MKKLATVLLLIWFTGCVSTTNKINRAVNQETNNDVTSNTFFSEKYPELSIKINDRLSYLGHFYEEKYIEYQDISGGSTHDFDYYYFIQSGPNKKISKLIEIRINKIRSGWLGAEMFPWMKPNFSSGTTEYLGKKYQFGTTVTGFGNGKNSNYILEKGYILPNSFLVKGIGRRTGRDNNIAFHVYYAEDINEIGGAYTNIKDWKKETGLNEEQNEILNSFLDRAGNSFEFSELELPKK